MNYLAHAYLSFGDTNLLVGNMISDYVKGKQIEQYPIEIQQGILLHRAVDQYTDAHAALKPAKELFRPAYRLYAGAFIDVVLDHYLAKQLHAELDLMAFTQHTYAQLHTQQQWFPLKFAALYPSMHTNNWLYNYQYNWGMQKSFTGLMRRAKYITEVETAFGIFEAENHLLQECFDSFWPDALDMATAFYNSYMNGAQQLKTNR